MVSKTSKNGSLCPSEHHWKLAMTKCGGRDQQKSCCHCICRFL